MSWKLLSKKSIYQTGTSKCVSTKSPTFFQKEKKTIQENIKTREDFLRLNVYVIGSLKFENK